MRRLESKPGFILAVVATLMAVVVIVLGAYTRLVDAGLGCPDWPTCYGHIWAPQTADEIAVANATYPELPVDLTKTWPEMVHRYLASGLGLVIIALTATCYRHRQRADQPWKLPLFLLAFVILQGAFGAWTVTLKLWPQVVTAHLIGGFTTFTLLALLAYRLSGYSLSHHLPNLRALRALATLALTAVAIQVFLGGWTTSNYAALACPDLPQCQTQWWPTMDFIRAYDFAHPIGPNYLGGQLELAARTAIHISHRIGAVVVTIVLLALTLALCQASLWRIAMLLIGLLSLQLVLGISNILFGLPLATAVLHNLGGALLLVSCALIRMYLAQQKELVYG